MLATHILLSDTSTFRVEVHISNGKAYTKHTSEGVSQHQACIALNIPAVIQTHRHQSADNSEDHRSDTTTRSECSTEDHAELTNKPKQMCTANVLCSKQIISASQGERLLTTQAQTRAGHLVEGSFLSARSNTQVSTTLIGLSGLPATRALLPS